MIKKTCKECGKEFTLSDSEVKFYKDKNLELPKRCKECRDKKKGNKENFDNNYNDRNTHKSKGNTLRNIIIAAVVIIASFFGINLTVLQDHQEVPNRNEVTIDQKQNYSFRNEKLLREHFEKHGSEFGYKNEEQYVKGAVAVINSPTSLHKKEAEDGDDIYYDKDKNEIVFVSKDGYIRSYFKPTNGINYYNKQ